MSFCCGASMIGTKGTLKHIRTRIHNVPILLCPVCNRIEIHHRSVLEYEILAEYAHGDGMSDVDFSEYSDLPPVEELFANCVSNDQTGEPLAVVSAQIDMALDLLAVSGNMGDDVWADQLRLRLRALAKRAAKLQRRANERMGGAL